MLMKIRFAVLEVPRKPSRWPVLRKPPKLHARDARHLLALSEALDAVDARCLRQSRDRRPCLHDLASSTAVRLLGFVAQTKKPDFRRRLRPRSRSGRHSCSPARAPVPAALHRRPPHGPSATAPPRQLPVDTRRPCTCNPKTKRTITPHG